MSGPWEQYGAVEGSGPWSQYASEERKPSEKRRSRRDQANEYAGKDVGEMGALMRGLGGAKTSFDRAAMGLKGLFTDLTPEDKALLAQGKAFEDEGGTAATVGSVVADAGMSMAPGAFVTKATAAAPLLARTAVQLGLGAGYGALTSPEDRTGGATSGALGTAVGMGINRALGGVLAPFVQPEAKALMAQGIQPTPGQAVGGTLNQWEQKSRSLPLAGDLIRKARERATNEFNEKAIQVALPEAKGFGDKTLTGVRKELGNRYDTILNSVPNLTVDQQSVLRAATAAVGDPLLALKAQDKKAVLDIVKNNVLTRTSNINAQVAKQIESDIAEAASNLQSDGAKKALRQVLDAWKASLKQTVESASPGSGAALRQNDAAWRAFIPVDSAGSAARAQNIADGKVPGTFTPNALRDAIERSDKSQNNNLTRALRDDLSPYGRLNVLTRRAESVLGDSVPDSGTAGRIGLMALGAGAGAAGSAAANDPTGGVAAGMLGTAALLAAPYTRRGSNFMIEGFEPLYKKAVQALALRGVPTQTVDEVLRKYGPQGVVALARGQALNQD